MTTLDTSGTAALLKGLQQWLLAFVPKDVPADTLATRLNGIYQVQVPDNAPFPYGVLRLDNNVSHGAYNADRLTADLELQLYDRPREKLANLERSADVADMALLRFTTGSTPPGVGVVFGRDRTRNTLPPFPAPADREVCAIRLVFPLTIWPAYLTQYHAG
jgi:hypothetical protein